MSARTILRCTLVIIAALLASPSAYAQLFRAYLASDGNDANPCTLAAPCRLLPAALTAVASGGEIWMLDSANYNTATVTIGKSVSILAVPGAIGSVVATGGPAILVSAPALKIALRNLVIVPLPGTGGTNGVSIVAASTLAIEDSLLANLPGSGVVMTGAGKLAVAGTTIRGSAAVAIVVDEGQADIVATRLIDNTNGGVWVRNLTGGTTHVGISDSQVSGGVYGIRSITSGAASVARAFVTRCTIRGTDNALTVSAVTGGTSSMSLGSSTVTGNSTGWSVTGNSTLLTIGNNQITDNGASSGAMTPTTPL
jgi:hypothetical protein